MTTRGHSIARARPSLDLYERGQERLSGAIVDSCAAGAGLSTRLERTLTAALSLLASDTELADLILVWPDRADEVTWQRRSEWRTHYGKLLRVAAESEGTSLPPFFVEPMLIGGVEFLASRQVRGRGARWLEELLPTIHWYLLSHYLSPAEVAGP